jgi:tRNA dimethylallyltransferase
MSNPSPFDRALILTGPTGSGKSRLALDLAERLGAEIVCMDSMTLYRGMDIGTAKPSAADRARVPHHLLDVLDPWESASVAWWLGRAAECCRDIAGRGRRPLLVGGTPLYLKALLYGLFEGPPADETVRRRLSAEAERDGPAALHARLDRVDPATAARLHPNDLRRVVRALEVWELTGRPISAWQTQWRRVGRQGDKETRRQGDKETAAGEGSAAAAPGVLSPCLLVSLSPCLLQKDVPRCLWLDLPRDVLYRRIDTRVERMIAEGLVEEVRALRRLDRPISRAAAQALGYKEMFDHLDGKTSLDETVQRIQTRSRNLAKRQLTWFRHLPECQPASEELTFRLWVSTMREDSR